MSSLRLALVSMEKLPPEVLNTSDLEGNDDDDVLFEKDEEDKNLSEDQKRHKATQRVLQKIAKDINYLPVRSTKLRTMQK